MGRPQSGGGQPNTPGSRSSDRTRAASRDAANSGRSDATGAPRKTLCHRHGARRDSGRLPSRQGRGGQGPGGAKGGGERRGGGRENGREGGADGGGRRGRKGAGAHAFRNVPASDERGTGDYGGSRPQNHENHAGGGGASVRRAADNDKFARWPLGKAGEHAGRRAQSAGQGHRALTRKRKSILAQLGRWCQTVGLVRLEYAALVAKIDEDEKG